MTFAIGSLVRARGREWVVLPESADDLLMVRPLGGTDDEVTGIYLPLETVEAATFDLPDPTQHGDYRSSRLLRDAIRLGFRSSAGPFRAFAKIAVEPRPYQLVPLLMALRLDPVRLLIADDVGIGKTVEAALIARELLDRGEVQRLAVLCPPHLAEQWQAELHDKFHLDAELVLPSTATRLERTCRLGQSLFDKYPYVVVSLDFIKNERRRDEFLRSCPELVIVDEAHTCADAGESRGSRQQRHQLIVQLAKNPTRHMLLVTATPHSGKDAAFRSLLTILNQDFANLPADLSGPQNEHHRRHLATHFVQRRRGDIRHYMDAETPFPTRESLEVTYKLSEDYRALFSRVLRFARELVADPALNDSTQFRQRVRWWSALALLRALASSPAAAAATLRSRAASADTDTVEEADTVGRRSVLDLVGEEAAEGIDLTPGSDIGDKADDEDRHRRRLLDLARAADALLGKADAKLQQGVKLVRKLLDDGHHPIVFCRFIATAEYVAAALRDQLPRDVEVVAVTGTLPPAEREARVAQLGQAKRRVLVATDCLSEGINLQAHFDAVLHYDLSWNPTRHEQREGRVDRYGQPQSTVRVVTYYGVDNQIDGIVLDVLIRKHYRIRSDTGVSVPVPVESDQVVEAILEGLLLRGLPEPTQASDQLLLPGMEDWVAPQKEAFFARWETNAEREKRSRTMFAQQSIKVAEVAQEAAAIREAIGAGADVAGFVRDALQLHGAVVNQPDPLTAHIDLTETPRALRDQLGQSQSNKQVVARFEPPVPDAAFLCHRTHPFVEGLATYVLDTALDAVQEGLARRCGVMTTSQVAVRTTLLLVRMRYHIVSQREGTSQVLLAEDCQTLAFTGMPDQAQWLDADEARALLEAVPDANTTADKATRFLEQVISNSAALQPYLEQVVQERGQALLEAHRRVRAATSMRGVRYRVEPQLPPDILGIYIYLPYAKL